MHIFVHLMKLALPWEKKLPKQKRYSMEDIEKFVQN